MFFGGFFCCCCFVFVFVFFFFVCFFLFFFSFERQEFPILFQLEANEQRLV